MLTERVALWLRISAIALFSVILASCGDGSGEDSINASADEVAGSKMELVFADDFGDPPTNGSRPAAKSIAPAPLGTGNWVVDTGYGENGWGNDEWQLYQNSIDNLFTENGNLVIRARCATAPACGKRDGSITSARVTSKNRIEVQYGSIKARIKMPSGAGMWPAFWTLGADIDDRPWPDAGEIDIVEMHYYYSDTRTTHFSTHWGGPRYTDANRPICSSGVAAIDADEEENCFTQSKTFLKKDGYDAPLTDDFHVYEVSWNENVIVGKIDGIVYFTQAIDGATMEEFLKEHFLILNVAVGGTLGGPGGPTSMKADDWADPNQTDMLVDWVEVWKRVPSSGATLWDNEFISDLAYNRIINTAEFNDGFVKANPKSTAVTPLKGSQVLELTYSTTRAENGGGVPADYAAAVFDFNSMNLSAYDSMIFSADVSRFDGLASMGVAFSDRQNNTEVRISTDPADYDPSSGVNYDDPDLKVIGVTGNWTTLEISLRAFAGIDMRAVTGIAIANPRNASGKLIAGTLYVDDIRFTRSSTCSAVASIEFDSVNYNPATSVAAVDVNDPCAANSKVRVRVENDLDEIIVGVKLDAAGNGRGIFNLAKENSVCESDDSSAILKLSGQLMATYERPPSARGGASSAFAMAGIDAGAPGTTITGKKSYFYATDPDQFLAFRPDVDFNYDVFGSGSTLNGAYVDSTFPIVFQVASGPNYGGEVAQVALINIATGFAKDQKALNFKFKNQGSPNNKVQVQIGALGGASTTVIVDLADTSRSTSLGDGWYEISVPMTEFPAVASANFMAFTSADPAPAPGNGFFFLITDIFLQKAAGSLPAECADEVEPPLSGSGTGATGATGGPFSVSFDDMAVTYGFVGFGNPDTINATGSDPVDSGNQVASTTKLSGAQVWAGVTVTTVPGITWPVSAAESEITIRIYSPGPGVVVRMKLEESGNAANSVETDAVTTVTTGWETLTFDFNNPAAGSPEINPAFSYDKLSLFFGYGSAGDGTTYTWDTIEFQGTGGSGGNLASNGDFEAGDLSGWTSAPGSGTIEAVDDQLSGSTWSGRMSTGMGNGAALSQANLAVNTVKTGDLIDVAFDLCGTTQGDSGEFAIALLSEFGSGAGADRQPLRRFNQGNLPSVWTRYNLQGIAGSNVAGGISLQFDAICGAVGGCGVETFVDNVSITIGGGMVDGVASGASCASGGGGPTAPVTSAPAPTRPAADVIAVFSDPYPIVLGPGPVDYNPNWGQGTVTTTETIAGNATLKYANLNYQGTDFGGPQDLTAAGMTSLHVDFWTTDATALDVYVIGAGESPVALTPNPGNWVSVDIPLTDFTGVDMSQAIQFKFVGNGTVFLDNLYFYCDGCGGGNAWPTTPTEAAPTPTVDAGDVLSIFSDAYTPAVTADFNPNWGQATVTTIESIAGNATLKYAGLNYQGTSWEGTPLDLTAAGMTMLHVDFWTVDSTALNVYVIGAGESAVALTPSFGNWVSVDIPLTDFTGVDMSQAIQFKFDGNGTIFLDNLYFFKTGGGGGPAGELALNGDFEADFTDWAQYPSAQTTQTIVTDPTTASKVARLFIPASAGGVNNVLKQERLYDGGGVFSAGDTIVVSFDYRGQPGEGIMFAKSICETAAGTCGDKLHTGGPFFPTASWTNYSDTFTLGAGVTAYTLEFAAVCGNTGTCTAEYFIDNVSITIQ